MRENFSRLHAINFYDFLPRGVAAKQFHFTARAVKCVRQQAEQGFVGSGVHGRGGYTDAEF